MDLRTSNSWPVSDVVTTGNAALQQLRHVRKLYWHLLT